MVDGMGAMDPTGRGILRDITLTQPSPLKGEGSATPRTISTSHTYFTLSSFSIVRRLRSADRTPHSMALTLSIWAWMRSRS